MVGTSDEVLDWITHHSEYAPLLQMSRQRLVGLRQRIAQGEVSEARKEEILEKLQKRIEALKADGMCPNKCEHLYVRKIRDRYIIPAVVRDHHGKFFTELTLVRIAEHEEKMHDLNLDMVCRAMKRGDFPSQEVVREVINRKHWALFEPRMILPSVWEAE